MALIKLVLHPFFPFFFVFWVIFFFGVHNPVLRKTQYQLGILIIACTNSEDFNWALVSCYFPAWRANLGILPTQYPLPFPLIFHLPTAHSLDIPFNQRSFAFPGKGVGTDPQGANRTLSWEFECWVLGSKDWEELELSGSLQCTVKGESFSSCCLHPHADGKLISQVVYVCYVSVLLDC